MPDETNPSLQLAKIIAPIVAVIYAGGSIGVATVWKPLSVTSLAVMLLLPAVAAALVGLNALRGTRPRGPLLVLYFVVLPLAAMLFIGGPVTVLAWLLSSLN